MEEKLFALDIGTRSVVGIILEKNGDSYRVVDLVSEEHGERSMLDGQIHNVLEVSNIIRRVKQQLEDRHGQLSKVCVAAAGRALKTQKASYEKNIYEQPLMDDEDVLHLELSAVQQAQYQLAEQEQQDQKTNYYCVGYSVLHYYLDGEEIGSLLDQQGEMAQVNIIATFLPKIVVDSLLSALKRADLEMEALTLEPIAAIQVLIPTSMRRLNVALVDIGAGTSDIAITSDGTVTAYGMVPKAGDEITESMSEQFLLDFHQAEKAKRELIQQNTVEIEDILGFKNEYNKKEVVQTIEYAIDELAKAICQQIIELNNQPPKAVMLVGGGSLTPALPEKIAAQLNLPKNRVAIRGIDAIQCLEEKEELPDSPEYVTPIGIAIAAKQSPVHYISVEVNQRTVRLFDLKQLTIGDCLLAAGIQINKLYGKPGMAMILEFNRKRLTLPGTLGQPPVIKINGNTASIQDSIKHHDVIEVEKGEDGETPQYTVQDVTGELPDINININDQHYHITPNVIINDRNVKLNEVLNDGDQIMVESKMTIETVLKKAGLGHYLDQFVPFKLSFNHQEITLFNQIVSITKNGNPVTSQTEVKDGDQLSIIEHNSLSVEELIDHLKLNHEKKIKVYYQQQPLTLSKDIATYYRNGQKLGKESRINPGDQIISEEYANDPFMFQDVFRYIELDLEEIKGSHFKLIRNGEEVGFIDEINDGDQLSIEWRTKVI